MADQVIGEAIYLLKDTGGLEKVPVKPYDSEDLLQSLIEKHPELLAGDQISPEDPIRWILVKREAGVPSGDELADRGSIDLLLLDQAGIPTFVETKRSSDVRIRREVVGQMLDYAANAQRYWPADRIRSMTAAQYGGDESCEQVITTLLELDTLEDNQGEIDAYWARVNENLHDGRIRLIFVADRLSPELRRVIEFLNEQMENAEVLGVELAQYAGSSIRALVPRLIGQTEAIRQRRKESTPAKKRLSREQFLATCSDEAKNFFQKAVEDSEARGMQPYWGSRGFSLRAADKNGTLKTLFYGFPAGGPSKTTAVVQGYVGYLADPDYREQVRQRFLKIPGATESGQYTVTIELTPASRDSAQRLLQVVWDVSKELKGASIN